MNTDNTDTPTDRPESGSGSIDASEQPAAITIDVVSDVVCPWCYVGKRQLEQALEMRRNKHPELPEPQVRWHPFQLNPDLPREGLARSEYLRAKFGDASGGTSYDNVKSAGQQVGLDLQLEQIERQPNTVLPHALIAMAQADSQDKIVEALFDGYFNLGRDLTREEELIELGRAGGLPEPIIEAALSDESVHQAVSQADSNARELGVTGVPFFIFNQRLAVSGAAGAETLLAAAEKAMTIPADESAEDQ